MLTLYRRWIYLVLGSTAAALSIFTFMFWPGASNDGSEPLAELPALGADINQTTVSGISSGAYMAGQFQVAHSKIVAGAAIIAGGPYGCAQSVFSGMAPGPGTVFLSASRAVNGCMLNALTAWGVPNPKRLAEKTYLLAKQRQIDPINAVKSDRIYLFAGTQDSTVKPPIVAAARDYYLALGVPKKNIWFETSIEAGHGFVTVEQGAACASSAQPYIVDCDYDQAGELLRHLYGDLAAPSTEPAGKFIKFGQKAFAPPGRNAEMSVTGVAYIPQTCYGEETCRVHVAFHGCAQNRSAVGSAFIEGSGFARWADTNRLIILFPQVSASSLNPTACWDWWGYTGNDYLTRTAPQISVVRAMIDRLASQPAAAQNPPAGS